MKKLVNFSQYKKINENKTEIYNELESRLSTHTGKIPFDDIVDIAQSYGKDEEEILDLVVQIEAKYRTQKQEDKETEQDALSEFAWSDCLFVGDKSYDCFKNHLLFHIETSTLEYNTKKEIIDNSKQLYNSVKTIMSEPTTSYNIPTVISLKIKDTLKEFPNTSHEEIYDMFSSDFENHGISKDVSIKLLNMKF